MDHLGYLVITALSSVITSSTIPHSTLNKHHNALSYHRVPESIAAKIIYFIHVSGIHNPSDVLTKFLGYAKLKYLIRPLLFWLGTSDPNNRTDYSIPIPIVIKESLPSSNSISELRGVSQNINSTMKLPLKLPANSHLLIIQYPVRNSAPA